MTEHQEGCSCHISPPCGYCVGLPPEDEEILGMAEKAEKMGILEIGQKPIESKADLCETCDAASVLDTEGKTAVVHNPHCPTIQKKADALPPWIVFRPGEEIPLKGFRFKVVGYTKQKFELILQCVGQTGKASKKARNNR